VAFQPGVDGVTAEGWKIAISDIDDMRVIHVPNWPLWEGFSEKLSTSQKGKMAVNIVEHLMRRGGFPFIVEARDSQNVHIQIKGTDIVVAFKTRVQVKCDYRAGTMDINGCTGNLFLQTAERNPLKKF